MTNIGGMSHKQLFIGLTLTLSVAVGSAKSLAKIDEAECSQVRALVEQAPHSIFFRTDRGYFPVNDVNAEELLRYLKQRRPRETKFVFFARADGDPRPTEFLVQQIFRTDNDWNFVGTFNNIRSYPLYVNFDIYQAYHNNGSSSRDLAEWFHLGPGLLTNRDLIDSDKRPLPRGFFTFPINQQDGRELRAYLLAVQGLREDGTCIDFSPAVPESIRELRFVIRNIRQLELGGYLAPIAVEQKFQ